MHQAPGHPAGDQRRRFYKERARVVVRFGPIQGGRETRTRVVSL